MGQNNLMKVQEGGCGWWGNGGCQDVPGAAPSSTAYVGGPANVSRGRATGTNTFSFLVSGRAASEASKSVASPLLPDANLDTSSPVSEELDTKPGISICGHSDISMR